MSRSTRLAIRHDHSPYRAGAMPAPAATNVIEIRGRRAVSARAPVAQVRKPDVVLIDLPHGGAAALADIALRFPEVRTVMLTASRNRADVAAAQQAGVRVYGLEGRGQPEIIEAVRAILGHEGDAPDSLPLLARIGRGARSSADGPARRFTAREQAIVTLVAQGMSNKEIAWRINCTERTVKHHMTNIMRKYQVRNRVQVALLGLGLNPHAEMRPEFAATLGRTRASLNSRERRKDC